MHLTTRRVHFLCIDIIKPHASHAELYAEEYLQTRLYSLLLYQDKHVKTTIKFIIADIVKYIFVNSKNITHIKKKLWNTRKGKSKQEGQAAERPQLIQSGAGDGRLFGVRAVRLWHPLTNENGSIFNQMYSNGKMYSESLKLKIGHSMASNRRENSRQPARKNCKASRENISRSGDNISCALRVHKQIFLAKYKSIIQDKRT